MRAGRFVCAVRLPKLVTRFDQKKQARKEGFTALGIDPPPPTVERVDEADSQLVSKPEVSKIVVLDEGADTYLQIAYSTRAQDSDGDIGNNAENAVPRRSNSDSRRPHISANARAQWQRRSLRCSTVQTATLMLGVPEQLGRPGLVFRIPSPRFSTGKPEIRRKI